MRFGSLFSGIGGLDRGFERAGGACAWQVENNPYALGVLRRWWPLVPKYEDVATFILDGVHAEPVECIIGGFPCTDLSLGNNRGKGLDGERSGLWRHYARIVRALRPRFVVVENVPALRRRGLDVVLGDLAACGYDALWDGVPAAAFGAHHVRDRLFVVAWLASHPVRDPLRFWAERDQWQGWRVREAVGRDAEPLEHGPVDGWHARPPMARVDDGPAARLVRGPDRERWRGLGNAVAGPVGEYVARCLFAQA